MKVRDLYPLITTAKLAAVRDFYVTHFGFAVAFEADWFVYLVGPGEEGTRGVTLAFMAPDHPSNPPGPEVFEGRGVILTIEVADVIAAHDHIKASGASISYGPTREPWGQHRFMTRDPAGVMIDVVEQVEPDPGFWPQYMRG